MTLPYLHLLQAFREATQGIFDNFMLQITTFGESFITFLLFACIYWCVDKRIGQAMGFNVAIGCTLNQFLKSACKIERPWIRDESIVPVERAKAGAGGYSFPSGHTSRVTAVWGTLGAAVWKERAKRGVSVLSWAVVGLVVFSRNYLGVHTFWDVFAAIILGIVLIFLVDIVLKWVDKNPEKDVYVWIAGCLLCFLPMLKVGCLSNAGAGMGLLSGWLLERRFVKFEVKGSAEERIVRFGIGGLILIVLLTGLSPFLALWMPSRYAGFFATFAVGLFIMAVYPYFIRQKADGKRIAFKAAAVVIGALLLCAVIAFAGQSIKERQQAEIVTEQQGEAADPQTPEVTEQQPEGVAAAEQSANVFTIPKIVAHRGYSAVFPENTLSAFSGAIDIGADLIELDVQLTKDGEVVVFHDGTVERVTGRQGAVSEFTLEELKDMDAGAWFSSYYDGEQIPTLEEALTLIRDSNCEVYLELKDIGEAEGFAEKVLETAKQCGMEERCIFASFRYEYLKEFKEMDAQARTLYNTVSAVDTLPENFPADYYGLWTESVTPETVTAVHEAGKQAYVWTAGAPEQIRNLCGMGVDGIVTNYPGMARVLVKPEYSYLAEHFEASFVMPGLYGAGVTETDSTMVVQGFAKAGNYLIVSAYSKAEENNSILYIMDLNGALIKRVDLGFRAHVGGVSYDGAHDLLWITGAEGHVYALSWQEILDGSYTGERKADFDAGLLNHNGSKVASFLTVDGGELYVGSYVDGASGMLRRYDISDIQNPVLLSEVSIPQRIQGITFWRDNTAGIRYMYLSQGYQTEDSSLLKFVWEDDKTVYEQPVESQILPEGAEQIQMTANGMYLLFESAARPYRATARIPNDQVWVIRP